MLDTPTLLDASDDLPFFVTAVRGHDDGNRLAHRLLGSVTEEPFCGSIPALDDSVRRLADDGILRRLDNRRQEATSG
jgi:hypothetical protein